MFQFDAALFYFFDPRIVTAINTLVIIIENPDLSVLEIYADITKSPGEFGSPFLNDDTHPPSGISPVIYMVTDLQI